MCQWRGGTVDTSDAIHEPVLRTATMRLTTYKEFRQRPVRMRMAKMRQATTVGAADNDCKKRVERRCEGLNEPVASLWMQ